jgi:hypothetical protein
MFKIDLAKAFDSVGWVFLLDFWSRLGVHAIEPTGSPPFFPLLALESFSMAPRGNRFVMVVVFDRGPSLSHALRARDGMLTCLDPQG